ncbi:MAG: AGE family epimerase/isomerase [Candidatus Thorarchaeota archaeon]|nr:MAG: AGE family epimerase/isomerase [Candidatus Thorarchaeota archaeon]
MYKKLIVAAILIALVATSTSNVGSPQKRETPLLLVESPSVVTQEQTQYNVSSYQEFAVATSDVLANRLVLWNDGTVWYYGYPDWGPVFGWAPSVADYYWAISGLARAYDMTGNATLSVIASRVANKMVSAFMDTQYPGFFVNLYNPNELIAQSKRPGVQAYAYYALATAESLNSSLDFTTEKQNALTCLTDTLYDSTYGGFRFLTYRNCTLDDEGDTLELYPNDGKRLDHLALAASLLFDVGNSTSNSTMLSQAESSLSFMISNMPYYNNSIYGGFQLATNRTGGEPSVPSTERPGRSVTTDINAMAIRALLKGYEVTGNSTYLEWAEDTHDALLTGHWDTDNGGWYAELVDGELWAPPDSDYEDTEDYKYSEIQFQMVLAEELLYEATDNLFYIRLVIDTLDIALAKLWDKVGGGFYANGDRTFEVFADDWKSHYTGVQSLALLSLERVWGYGLPIVSYVRVAPTNPRPTDPVTFVVTATDDDGIDTVLVNYTSSLPGSDNVTIIELLPNPEFGGVYNATIEPLANGTRVNFVIIANDTLGNVFIAGSYFFISRVDVWGPVVLWRAIYPSDEVRVGDTVVVEFGTYEFPTHSTLEMFQIYWKVNAAAYVPMNMTAVDVDGQYIVWVANLGSDFREGDVISYYCLAVDESGNTGQSAFYRLTILGPVIFVTPWSPWQVAATIGLVAAPGVGYGLTRIRRQRAMATQRELKKEARKRSRKKRPRRVRSTRSA